MNKRIVGILRWSLVALTAGWLSGSASLAATFNISVGDNFFLPANQNINVGDTVIWTWTGNSPHNVTSTSVPSFPNSGNKTRSQTYTNTFSTAATYNYICTIHAGQNGTITVQAANTPPIVSITSPTNNTTLLAGSSPTIQGTATDSDGTVTRVDLYASGFLLGSVTTAPFNPFSFTSTKVSAGNYILTAVATDNAGATNTSAGVNVQVLTNATLVANSAAISAAAFTVSNSFAGQTYFIEALTNLSARAFIDFGAVWFTIATNTASSNNFSFSDTVLTNPFPRLYRVRQTY